MGKVVSCSKCRKAYRNLEDLGDLRDNDGICLVCNSSIEVEDWDRVLASYEDEDYDDVAEDIDEDDFDDDDFDDDDFGEDLGDDLAELDEPAKLDGDYEEDDGDDEDDGDGDDLDPEESESDDED